MNAPNLTFVRVVNGIATDVCFGPDVSTATSQAFAAGYISNLGGPSSWLPVAPNVTVSSGYSVTVSNGTITAAIAPSGPAPQPIELSGVTFHNYCAGVLAVVNSISPTQGMARLGSILQSLQAQASSSGGLLMIAWVRYQAAGSIGGKYSLGDVQTLMAALASATIVTAQEAAAITGNWPTQ